MSRLPSAVKVAAPVLGVLLVVCSVVFCCGRVEVQTRNGSVQGAIGHADGSRTPTPNVDPMVGPKMHGRVPQGGPRAHLNGHLRLESGDRPEHACVYLLPKKGGETTEPTAVVHPDREGCWSLGTLDPSGAWIAAVADGHCPAFRDGDSWAGGEILFELDRGRQVEVHVRSGSWPLPPDTSVRVLPVPWYGFSYPPPLGCRPFDAKFSVGPEGVSVFRVPTRGPVRVEVSGSGYRAEPTAVELPSDEERAEFALVPMCVIDIQARDAETGWDLEMQARVSVRDLSTGRRLPDWEGIEELDSLDLHHFMGWMRKCGVTPGRYSVQVECEGYAPFGARHAHLTMPGEHVLVQASMSLAPQAGKLDLELALPSHESLVASTLHLRLRRLAGAPASALDWRMPVQPRSIDVVRSIVRLGPLRLGRYAILAWAGANAVGRTEVSVHEGDNRATVVVGPGLTVDLGRVLGPDPGEVGPVVGIDLQTSEGEPLPKVLFGSLQPQAKDTEADNSPDPAGYSDYMVPRDAVLGPYPYDEVHVVEGRREKARRWVVRVGDR